MSDGRLLRVLGVGFGLAVIIGNAIGAGIFRAPGQVAAHLRDPGLFLAAWAAGGLYALIGAIQIAELGTMLARSGGQYVFSRYALGEYAGFLVGWSDWISTCGTTAAVTVVIAESSPELLPVFGGSVPALAGTVAVAFAAAQWRGIRQGSLIQNVTSVLKGAAFAALIISAFVVGGTDAAAGAAEPSVASGLALATAFVLALQSVIYTYDGWTGVVYFSEEVRDPGRSIPRALFAGVLTLTAIYLLVNLSFLYVLPVGAIAGEEFAAGAVASALFGDSWRPSAACPDDCLDAQCRQRVPLDGKPRALFDGPRRPRRRARRQGQRRRHADGRIAAQHGRRRAVHHVRPDLRKGHHAAGLLLHRQLHAVVHFLDRPSAAGA